MNRLTRLTWNFWIWPAVIQLVLAAVVFGVVVSGKATEGTNLRGRQVVAVALACAAAWGATWWAARRQLGPWPRLLDEVQQLAAGAPTRVHLVPDDSLLQPLSESLQTLADRVSDQQKSQTEGQQLSAVLDHMVEGVLAVDGERHVRFANRAAGEMLGFELEQATDRPLPELVRYYLLHRLLDEAMSSGTRQRAELIVGRQSPRRVLNVSATPLSNPGGLGATIVMTDISELRRLESLRQDFIANVSHELKTPLSSIKAYAETLINGALYDERANLKFLKGIDEQAERLHRLIKDMLSLARIESGRKAFEMAPVEVRKMAEICIADYQPAAQAKNISLAGQLDGLGGVLVHADEEGLREIIGNLIDNAIKYTPSGGRVDVFGQTAGDEVVVEVHDTGIGVPAEHLDRLFERFYRVDKARSRELGGTGLGLSIVKHLCQVFRGSVSVTSQPNHGSQFRVMLPKATQQPAGSDDPSHSSSESVQRAVPGTTG